MRRGKKAFPKPYKSYIEYELATGPLKNLDYEPFIIEYTPEPREYTPDFVGKPWHNPYTGTIITYWYEVKGRCRTFEELKKYIGVRRALEEHRPGTILRFILSNPDVKAYPQSKKITLGQWLTKNNFEWCSIDNIPEEWKQ